MSRKHLPTAIALGASLAAAGCVLDGEGVEEFDTPCAGKCDDTQLPAITALDGLDLEIVNSDPDSGTEVFALVSGVADGAVGILSHGDTLHVRVSGTDGTFNPTYSVEATIAYDDRGLFFGDRFEAAFLPWQELTFDVYGELGEGYRVDQTFVVSRSDCGYFEGVMSCPAAIDSEPAPIAALDGLDLEIVESDPDSGLETFALVSGPHADAADLLVHGDSFDVRVVGSDGAADPSYAVSTSIEFDDRGFFFADDFDAAFLPWQQLTFDVSGELDGRPVNQTFVVSRSDCGFFEGVMSCPGE